MSEHEEGKRRGRPPLDPNDSSVAVHLVLPAREYDAIHHRAALARVSVPEQTRREIARVARDRERSADDG